MKRNLCFLVILLIYLTSCQDDKGRDLNGISENLKSNAVLRATNEVLIFDSWDEYENAIDELDNQIEVADNAFLSQFGHLDDDSLNIIEDSIRL